MGFWDYLEKAAPYIGAGLSIYDAYQKGQARDDIAKASADREKYKYDQAMANHAAFQQYADQIAGLYGGYANAVAGKNAALLGAHGEQEAARLQQGKKANKRLNKARKRGRKLMRPYVAAGQMMLPQHMKAASQGIQGMGLLNAYLHRPENLAKLNQSGPALQVGAKAGLGSHLPSWMEMDKKGGK